MEPKNDMIRDGLLTVGVDPEPVEVIYPGSTHPLLLVCEHAGVSFPQTIDRLGLTSDQLGMHIASDIGAETVARKVSDRFQCTLILQRYSRLVIDCNRQPGEPSSIPEISDSVVIPGNENLSDAARKLRETEIFEPFTAACEAQIKRKHFRYTYSIHSFTSEMAGVHRPWDIAFLYRHPSSRAAELANLCKTMWPELSVGHNEPYDIQEGTDWYIPMCAEPRGLPHCLIEIRNDHLLDAQGCAIWADRLSQLFIKFMESSNATDT
ncbi:N-formylglutamate amidohydrolase [uncultured Maritalea sp.]|uniref:N-formylglutamate amidohydrolase n=1 Tax=uncultured Maritalea sp. TaxID=757249 RepID=UPI002616E582|nr:N-formylglutamate amidohydrolase [uncultured Maritalea sp.]